MIRFRSLHNIINIIYVNNSQKTGVSRKRLEKTAFFEYINRAPRQNRLVKITPFFKLCSVARPDTVFDLGGSHGTITKAAGPYFILKRRNTVILSLSDARVSAWRSLSEHPRERLVFSCTLEIGLYPAKLAARRGFSRSHDGAAASAKQGFVSDSVFYQRRCDRLCDLRNYVHRRIALHSHALCSVFRVGASLARVSGDFLTLDRSDRRGASCDLASDPRMLPAFDRDPFEGSASLIRRLRKND